MVDALDTAEYMGMFNVRNTILDVLKLMINDNTDLSIYFGNKDEIISIFNKLNPVLLEELSVNIRRVFNKTEVSNKLYLYGPLYNLDNKTVSAEGDNIFKTTSNNVGGTKIVKDNKYSFIVNNDRPYNEYIIFYYNNGSYGVKSNGEIIIINSIFSVINIDTNTLIYKEEEDNCILSISLNGEKLFRDFFERKVLDIYNISTNEIISSIDYLHQNIKLSPNMNKALIHHVNNELFCINTNDGNIQSTNGLIPILSSLTSSYLDMYYHFIFSPTEDTVCILIYEKEGEVNNIVYYVIIDLNDMNIVKTGNLDYGYILSNNERTSSIARSVVLDNKQCSVAISDYSIYYLTLDKKTDRFTVTINKIGIYDDSIISTSQDIFSNYLRDDMHVFYLYTSKSHVIFIHEDLNVYEYTYTVYKSVDNIFEFLDYKII